MAWRASDSDRQVDQEGEPPAAELDQGATDRRPDPGGERRRGTPQTDRVAATVLGERLDDDRQRGGHEESGTDRLDHPEGDQHLQRPGGSAGHGGQREQDRAEREHPTAAQQVGEPAADDQEGREDDVVGVEHPRQVADRAGPER